MTVYDTGANIAGTPRLALGVCAGDTNIMGDSTVTHFAGIITTEATWARSTTPTRYAGLNVGPCKKVGSTLTTGSDLSAATNFLTSSLSMLFVDITVGSPNYSFRMFGPNASNTAAATLSDFNTQILLTTPSFTNYTYATAQTVAVSEVTNGTFDHANVWWDQNSPDVDIAAWRIVRLV